MLSFIFMPWIVLMYSISTCNTLFLFSIFFDIDTHDTFCIVHVTCQHPLNTMSKTDTQAAAKKTSTKAKKPKWDKNE